MAGTNNTGGITTKEDTVQLAVVNAISRHTFRLLLAAVAFMLAFGTIFYHFTEKWSWLNAYYFCVVTLSTVGYGDYTPHTDAGKLFTTFYILAGVGVITTFVSTLVRRSAQRYSERAQARQSGGNTPDDKP